MFLDYVVHLNECINVITISGVSDSVTIDNDQLTKYDLSGNDVVITHHTLRRYVNKPTTDSHCWPHAPPDGTCRKREIVTSVNRLNSLHSCT